MPRSSAARPPDRHARATLADRRPSGPPFLPFDDINRLYPGEWVLIRVTRVDEGQGGTQGVVLEHSTSRRRIARAEERARREDPGSDLRVVIGGTGTTTVDEWRQALRRAAALGPLRAGG